MKFFATMLKYPEARIDEYADYCLKPKRGIKAVYQPFGSKLNRPSNEYRAAPIKMMTVRL